MSFNKVLDQFATGFSLMGILLKTENDVIPLVESDPFTLLLTKRLAHIPEGISVHEITKNVENEEKIYNIGILKEKMGEDKFLLIFSDSKSINEISTHWKRFLPIVKNQMAKITEFSKNQSPEIKLIALLEDIRESYDSMKNLLT